ncbi:MAG: lipoprotein-releasing ABC transporter permease subunit [Rickettsiales bacterium]|nr:lipoprotein-releasing ABC transporter permease subunit [Rickettsiales bacterium]
MIFPNAYERMMAWRYLKAQRRQGFVSIITLFSILGITLGVATLILVTSLMNGIRAEMSKNFLGIDGHVSVLGVQGGISHYEEVTEKLSSMPEVIHASAKVVGQVMASFNGQSVGAQVLALPPKSYDHKPLIKKAIDADVLQRLGQGEGVVIGERLARSLNIGVGSQITLISPQGRQTFMGLVPRMKAYTVLGTLSLGMHLYDASLVLMPFEEAQIYFQLSGEDGGRASEIEVLGVDPYLSETLALEVEQNISGPFYVTHWQRSNASYIQALDVQRNVMVIILALIIVVAAFNIISSLIMLVQGKRSQIAIMRTIGAERGSIMRIFCLSGSLIGIIGTALGLVLGVLCATYLEAIKQWLEAMLGFEILVENIYFLSTLPTKTDFNEVIAIVVGALLISFLAALYPAWKASKVRPVEALRYE